MHYWIFLIICYGRSDCRLMVQQVYNGAQKPVKFVVGPVRIILTKYKKSIK